MKFHKYYAFGLNIDSELPLPELTQSSHETGDVKITFDKTPENLNEINGKGALYQVNDRQFLFRLETVGSYWVTEGDHIKIERLNNSTDQEIRLFLLGSAFGALIHQRGLLPLHGSSVIKGNKVLTIVGASGAGKSSLSARLIKEGFKLLADDVSVINENSNKLFIYPGVLRIKLWQDVMRVLNEDPSLYDKVRPQLEKYNWSDHNNVFRNDAEPNTIISLSTKNSAGIEINQVHGFEKFNILKNNTYRYRFLEGMNQMEKHFNIVNKLAQRTNIYTIKRPISPVELDKLAAIAISTLN